MLVELHNFDSISDKILDINGRIKPKLIPVLVRRRANIMAASIRSPACSLNLTPAR